MSEQEIIDAICESKTMYCLKDFYDNFMNGDLVGMFMTLKDAIDYADYYDQYEVDGECDLEIYQMTSGNMKDNRRIADWERGV